METNIKVGVIGPQWIRETMVRCFGLFPNIQPIFRLSDEIKDAKKLTTELLDKVDCLFYSGRIPYLVAKDEIPIETPAFYIPLKGAGLYQSLYKLKSKQNFMNISLDGIQDNYMELIKSNLEETFSYQNFQEIVYMENKDDVVNFHLRNVEEIPNTVVITSLKLVSEQLSEMNIINEWLKPTDQDIIVAIERMLLATNQRKQKEMQIIVGRIFIENSCDASEFMSEQQVHTEIMPYTVCFFNLPTK